VGNRLSSLGVSPYNYNSSNELTSTPSGSYTYDNNGNTLTDPSGKSYTWDFENRLTQVVVPGTGTVTFKYDPFGRRVQKSGPSGTVNYLYDGENLLEEIDQIGNLLARYTQVNQMDEVLAELRSSTSSYYQGDGLGTVTALSNSTGALANTYTYSSFGKPITSTGTLVNSLRYTGREWDSETGFYYYRARYYDSEGGRFLSEDPIRLNSGTVNFYGYADDDPINEIDPSGLARIRYG
jgi:RHS repeat-associated protein